MSNQHRYDSTEWDRMMQARTSRRRMLRTTLGLAAATVGVEQLGVLLGMGSGLALADAATGGQTAVVHWNNAALQAIRETKPGPPMVARALAVVHTCIYDAWCAYDPVALPTDPANAVHKMRSHRSQAHKTKAVSYAAFRALLDLFPAQEHLFVSLLTSLGYDPVDASHDTRTPSGIGNMCARAILSARHGDGSNQHNGYADITGYPEAYADYPAGYATTLPNSSTAVYDPDHWQPLRPEGAGHDQLYVGPHWGLVVPFALSPGPLSSNPGAQYRPAPGPQTTPFGPGTEVAPGYVAQAKQMLTYSAGLTDRQKVIAEYWKDGPSSELPPGHWCLLGQFVSQRDKHGLDDDVKIFFALTNALLDAGIAAWDAKRYYNSVRPITAIHYLSAVPIQAGGFLDPAKGSASLSAWAGPCLGARTIDGSGWQPYQPATIVTPPFPEYISGHSTFSAAGAEILKRFTGSDRFGASVNVPAGSSSIEQGCTPRTDITLSWPTFSHAADEAGLSRRFGGIHFRDGDLAGRSVGRRVGKQVWHKAQAYIHGHQR